MHILNVRKITIEPVDSVECLNNCVFINLLFMSNQNLNKSKQNKQKNASEQRRFQSYEIYKNEIKIKKYKKKTKNGQFHGHQMSFV